MAAAEARYLAFDLGAESGRAVMGLFEGERIRLQDVHRFANQPVKVLDTLHWDVLKLFAELKRGLGMAAAALTTGQKIEAIGIDTWGVDFCASRPRRFLLRQPTPLQGSRQRWDA